MTLVVNFHTASTKQNQLPLSLGNFFFWPRLAILTLNQSLRHIFKIFLMVSKLDWLLISSNILNRYWNTKLRIHEINFNKKSIISKARIYIRMCNSRSYIQFFYILNSSEDIFRMGGLRMQPKQRGNVKSSLNSPVPLG